jgi:hypothetical protein
MSDNVLILGAGFSYDAGIPLLGGFVGRMLDYALRRSCNGQPLSPADIAIFENAIKIRNELDRYHGRAEFDDRNLEDILSILSFDALDGSRKGRAKLTAINKAIAKTIELSCTVNAPDIQPGGVHFGEMRGPEIYRNFWKALFAWVAKGNYLPTIITFNYDLVLERSLVQELMSDFTLTGESDLPFDNFVLRYHYPPVPDIAYRLEPYIYQRTYIPQKRNILKGIDAGSTQSNPFEIEILKLHGSLNFYNPKQAKDPHYNFMYLAPDPYILPPVFNKMSSDSPGKMWERALAHLRQAKNIVIVGYSLPQTDIYMQYFLKAGVGPNVDLNRIFVFDPILFSEKKREDADAMKERYASCFSTQLRRRIDFNPASCIPEQMAPGNFGTTHHLVLTR